MGLFTLTLTGCGFLVIGALEALSPFTLHPPPLPLKQPQLNPKPDSSLSFLAISLLSFLFIVNSLVSLFDALNSRDRVGSALQFQVLAVAALFLLYSDLGLLRDLLPLPSSLLDLIALFAFVQEFLLFYLRRKDPSGIENRYFDLMLLPITVCIFSTLLFFRSPTSHLPRLSRGVGLILQGTWFLQMGFSFYSNFIVHGCSLTEKSRGNYTIRCKGHPDYHRGRAIATLQFNCHLALMVVVVVGFYGLVAGKNVSRMYMPLGRELQNQPQFTLDSDDEIKEDENVEKQNGAMIQLNPLGNGTRNFSPSSFSFSRMALSDMICVVFVAIYLHK